MPIQNICVKMLSSNFSKLLATMQFVHFLPRSCLNLPRWNQPSSLNIFCYNMASKPIMYLFWHLDFSWQHYANLATFYLFNNNQSTLYYMSSKHLNKMQNHYVRPIWVTSIFPNTCTDFGSLWPSIDHLVFINLHTPKQGLAKLTCSKHPHTPH